MTPRNSVNTTNHNVDFRVVSRESCDCYKKPVQRVERSHSELDSSSSNYVLDGYLAKRLLQQICFAPLRLFTAEMVESSIACWLWILAGRPQITMQFLGELASSWQMSVDQGLGVFAYDDGSDQNSPLVVTDEDTSNDPANSKVHSLRSSSIDAAPHRVWVKFLCERLYIAQCSCQEQVDVFVNLLQSTLAGEVDFLRRVVVPDRAKSSADCEETASAGWADGTLSRNIAALDVRFRLVEMGLMLLQSVGLVPVAPLSEGLGTSSASSSLNGSVITPSALSGTGVSQPLNASSNLKKMKVRLPPLVRAALREKTYAALLNYFSMEPMYPRLKGKFLKEELDTVLTCSKLEDLFFLFLPEMQLAIPVPNLFLATSSSAPSPNGGLTHSASGVAINMGQYSPPLPSTDTLFVNVNSNNFLPGSYTSPEFHRFNSLTSPNDHAQTVTGSSGGTLSRDFVTNSNMYSTLPMKTTGSLGRRSAVSNTDVTSWKELYMRKRSLIMLLLATEIERLTVWLNPASKIDFTIPGQQWLRSRLSKERSLSELPQLAWQIAPSVSIYLPQRFTCKFFYSSKSWCAINEHILGASRELVSIVQHRYSMLLLFAPLFHSLTRPSSSPNRLRSMEKLNEDVAKLVSRQPSMVAHIPAALQYLATANNIKSEFAGVSFHTMLNHVLTWCPVPPLVALSFFSRVYPQHPLTHQYAIRVLESYPPDTLLFYTPQMVQALRYDKLGYLAEFILKVAQRSPLVAHQLLWNMKTNIFRDEDGKVKDPDIGELLEQMTEIIKANFKGSSLDTYQREFDFFDKITGISGEIRPFPKGPERKAACLQALRRIKLQPGCYLPSNPDAIILEIDYNSGTPMQSAAKAPFLARFKVQRCGVKQLEQFSLNPNASPSREGTLTGMPAEQVEAVSSPQGLKSRIRAASKLSSRQSMNQEETSGGSPAHKSEVGAIRRKTSVLVGLPSAQAATHERLRQLEVSDHRHRVRTISSDQIVNQGVVHKRSSRSSKHAMEPPPSQQSEDSNKQMCLPPGPVSWQACIFKVGDDVRQDILALQLVQLFKNIFNQCELELFLFPYRVVATAPGSGVIECVPDSKSRDQIGRQTDSGLYDYFQSVYGEEKSPAYQAARRNFIMSVAAYSVVCYILQLKDRHNGNIMLDKYGHLIHIDFGFMFESSPGGNMGFEPDIKLTKEMLMIMGGSVDSAPFHWFEQLTTQAYLSIRPYREAIVALVSLMLDTGLPCFRGQTIKQLRSRFYPSYSDRDAAKAYLKMVHSCLENWRAKTYDFIQYRQNQIH
ncbi:hypothetical protein Ciccas_001098 [Cichlidogyrus casuarinus]|uniref:1-phosphatidylinositol 4-kinase n=1 Tax=Cichlidogyrus casuarinus TaxID=1844966 RepID=A0ABD2QM54_9PLAT